MEKYDCCFQKENGWFRYRAAAIIIEDNCVLLATNDSADYYYSVGGGVHIGETSEDAVKREVFEETGVHYEIDRLAFIHENFFIGDYALYGITCHEVAFYYLMKSQGLKNINSLSITSSGENEYMHWLPIDRLSEYKAYPVFFAEKLKNIPAYPQHIVTNEICN